MDDLISRAFAQTELQFAARRYTVAHEAHGELRVVWGDELISVTDAMNTLRNVPSAQPKRKKGKWIMCRSRSYATKYRCNKCGQETDDTIMGKPRWNYCPNCGADMREEQG